MAYFLRRAEGFWPSPSVDQIWKIEDDEAELLGVSNPKFGPGSYFKANPGETVWDAIRRQATGWLEPEGHNPFYEIDLAPGQYYPRIARPLVPSSRSHPIFWCPSARSEQNAVAIARSQLQALGRELERICQTVHPKEPNFGTFGHDIRNLLILACTEVEAHWRGVLKANGESKDRYNTSDYVKLQGALKLDEYSVTFPTYPWLEPLCPFRGWGSTGKATQELAWYDAYNAVKHNRESEFERSTLRHVFEAVSACFIMMVAQFGERGSFFYISSRPDWPISDVYIAPFGTPNWSPMHFKFSTRVP